MNLTPPGNQPACFGQRAVCALACVVVLLFTNVAWAQCTAKLLNTNDDAYGVELARHHIAKRRPLDALAVLAPDFGVLRAEIADPKSADWKHLYYPQDDALELIAVGIVRTQGEVRFGSRLTKAAPEEAKQELAWALAVLEALNTRSIMAYSRVRELRIAEALVVAKRDAARAQKIFAKGLNSLAESAVVEAAITLARSHEDQGQIEKLKEIKKAALKREDSTLSKSSGFTTYRDCR